MQKRKTVIRSLKRICRLRFVSLSILACVLSPVLAETELEPEAGMKIHITQSRQSELLNLLRQDCGSCHGMTLKGGLGPALTPEQLSDKSIQMLVQTILAGRPGTPMPPWAPFITRYEAEWLVKQLKAGTIAASQIATP